MTSMTFGLASTICSYMGYDIDSYKLVTPGKLDGNVPTVITARTGTCKNVEITCHDDRCGQRPLYRNLAADKTIPNKGEGTWPWQASFFVEGSYICGGTVVDRKFIVTELSCAKMLVTSGSYITVLVGQDRRTKVGFSPHSQIRRIVSLKVTSNSNVVLAQVSHDLQFDEYVNQLCLTDSFSLPSASCVIAGASHSSYSNFVKVRKMCL